MSKLDNHCLQLVTLENRTDETGTTTGTLLKEMFYSAFYVFAFTNCNTSHGNIGGYLSFSPYATSLRLVVPCLRC